MSKSPTTKTSKHYQIPNRAPLDRKESTKYGYESRGIMTSLEKQV